MPASNLTPGTALDIGPFPSVTTIAAADVQGAPTGTGYVSTCDSAQRHALWFKYTTGASEIIIAVGIRGALVSDAYNPVMSVWTGTPPAVVQHKVQGPSGLFNNLCHVMVGSVVPSDQWFSFPVDGSTTYYFQVTDANATTVVTDLVVIGQSAPPAFVPSEGDYVVPNEFGPFPGAIISQQTGALMFTPNVGAGDVGAFVATGETMGPLPTIPVSWLIWDAALAPLATIVTPAAEILTSFTNFYLVTFTGDTAHVQMVHTNGTLGPLVNVPNVGEAFFISADGSIFYYVDNSTFTTIQRWDLINNAALSQFSAAFGSDNPDQAFVSGGSATICILYDSGPSQIFRTFSNSGTLLTQTTLIAHVHLMSGDTGADTFALWDGSVAFSRYAISAPTVALSSVVAPGAQSTNGGPQPVPFAVSTSCPLLVVQRPTFAFRPPWPLVPPFVAGVGGLETVAQRRLRIAPHLSAEQFQIFYDQFTLDLQVGNGVLTGQGVNPQIMLRMSDDGGYTWSDEILLDSGAQGQYLTRVTANGLGQARDRVFEISTSDPVSWSIIGAYLNTRKGRW